MAYDVGMVAIRAQYDGKVLVPDELLNLQAGQRLLIRIESEDARPTPRGVPGASLLAFAGSLSADEAAEMMRDIDEGSGKVDPDGW